MGGFQISVTVQGMSANGMTYVTNLGHVKYTQDPEQWNSQIGFVSYDLGLGEMATFVIAQGSWDASHRGWASNISGVPTEEATWDSLLDDIAKDCRK